MKSIALRKATEVKVLEQNISLKISAKLKQKIYVVKGTYVKVRKLENVWGETYVVSVRFSNGEDSGYVMNIFCYCFRVTLLDLKLLSNVLMDTYSYCYRSIRSCITGLWYVLAC